MSAGKPTRSEAARIVNRLQLSGMKRAEIAHQLGTSAETIRNITRGLSSGDSYLESLRGMLRYVAPGTATDGPDAANTGSYAGDRQEGAGEAATPSLTGTPSLASTQAATPGALDTVDAPRDERSSGQKFKDGLKDALLGKAKDSTLTKLSTATKKASRDGATNETLTEQLVPILALGTVILTQLAIPARYSAVGPTSDEAGTILKPLIRLMTRQLEVAGQLTETQLDVLASLAAIGLYTQRAWDTYRDIRKREARSTVNEHPDGRRNDYRAGGGYAPSAVHAASGSAGPAAFQPGAISRGGAGQAGPQARGEHSIPVHAHPDHQQARSNGAAAANGHDAAGADPFAAIYAADAIGRRQLGIN